MRNIRVIYGLNKCLNGSNGGDKDAVYYAGEAVSQAIYRQMNSFYSVYPICTPTTFHLGEEFSSPPLSIRNTGLRT